ncbi:MAG TPA: PilZ domain-containing protein [Kofleriaceae bacterium]
MTDERRASPRHTAHLAGELETDQGKSAIAITRDVSAGGLAVFTRLRLDVGTPVKLLVLWNDERIVLSGSVVREQAVEPHESTLWRSKVAIAIDPQDPGLAKIIAALPAT